MTATTDSGSEDEMFGSPTCGSEAGCFVMFGGDVWHDPNWHRAQELEAENERLRAELQQVKDDYRDYVRSMTLGLEHRAADRA